MSPAGCIAEPNSSEEYLVRIRDLRKYFPVKTGLFSRTKKFVKAVDGVSFDIVRGENLALVGESGCGKTTTALLMLRLLEPTSGSVYFAGKDLFKLTKHQMRLMRPKMQIIFQDPYASLNPRKTMGQILQLPLRINTDLSREDITDSVLRLLQMVGLTPAELFVDRYPHQLSGGQRQRVCIARAIALSPLLVLADEPVSALDVSVRAQILNLLKDLGGKLASTYLYITHDLAVVRSISDRVAVMYLGKLAEVGEVSAIFKAPLHPYTSALLSATPIPDPDRSRSRDRVILGGDVPSPLDPPKGCRFHTRCPSAMTKCKEVEPQLMNSRGRLVACHLYS